MAIQIPNYINPHNGQKITAYAYADTIMFSLGRNFGTLTLLVFESLADANANRKPIDTIQVNTGRANFPDLNQLVGANQQAFGALKGAIDNALVNIYPGATIV